jgi:hypothetical protein
MVSASRSNPTIILAERSQGARCNINYRLGGTSSSKDRRCHTPAGANPSMVFGAVQPALVSRLLLRPKLTTAPEHEDSTEGDRNGGHRKQD